MRPATASSCLRRPALAVLCTIDSLGHHLRWTSTITLPSPGLVLAAYPVLLLMLGDLSTPTHLWLAGMCWSQGTMARLAPSRWLAFGRSERFHLLTAECSKSNDSVLLEVTAGLSWRLLIIALLAVISSRGTAFYVQLRHGIGGRTMRRLFFEPWPANLVPATREKCSAKPNWTPPGHRTPAAQYLPHRVAASLQCFNVLECPGQRYEPGGLHPNSVLHKVPSRPWYTIS